MVLDLFVTDRFMTIEKMAGWNLSQLAVCRLTRLKSS